MFALLVRMYALLGFIAYRIADPSEDHDMAILEDHKAYLERVYRTTFEDDEVME